MIPPPCLHLPHLHPITNDRDNTPAELFVRTGCTDILGTHVQGFHHLLRGIPELEQVECHGAQTGGGNRGMPPSEPLRHILIKEKGVAVLHGMTTEIGVTPSGNNNTIHHACIPCNDELPGGKSSKHILPTSGMI